MAKKKVRRHFILVSVFVSVICLSLPSGKAEERKEQSITLQECTDKILGFKMYCNPNWGLETEKGSVSMIIAEGPVSVTAMITKMEEPDLTLNDLTPVYLKATGQYQDAMKISSTHLQNYDLIHVEALALKNAQTQLSDYYIIRKPYLYGVLFSVDPKEKFADYKALFDKMIDSFLISDGQ